jgi:hypothetical protein
MTMDHHDIRLFDKHDPKTPPDIVKAMSKEVADASDKYETFTITHDPIKLKEKLAVKKRIPAPKAYVHVEEEEEIIDEDYTDDDDDGLEL